MFHVCVRISSGLECAPRKDYQVFFEGRGVKFFLSDSEVAQGMQQTNEIYRMLFRVIRQHEANLSATSLQQWHERVGHVNEKTLQTMVKNGIVRGVDIKDKSNFTCESCKLGKADLLPFKKDQEHRKWQPGEFFHTDVCSTMSVNSVAGSRFFHHRRCI